MSWLNEWGDVIGALIGIGGGAYAAKEAGKPAYSPAEIKDIMAYQWGMGNPNVNGPIYNIGNTLDPKTGASSTNIGFTGAGQSLFDSLLGSALNGAGSYNAPSGFDSMLGAYMDQRMGRMGLGPSGYQGNQFGGARTGGGSVGGTSPGRQKVTPPRRRPGDDYNPGSGAPPSGGPSGPGAGGSPINPALPGFGSPSAGGDGMGVPGGIQLPPYYQDLINMGGPGGQFGGMNLRDLAFALMNNADKNSGIWKGVGSAVGGIPGAIIGNFPRFADWYYSREGQPANPVNPIYNRDASDRQPTPGEIEDAVGGGIGAAGTGIGIGQGAGIEMPGTPYAPGTGGFVGGVRSPGSGGGLGSGWRTGWVNPIYIDPETGEVRMDENGNLIPVRAKA